MTMTSRSERSKLANRMSVSLGNIPALLYPSSSAWSARPQRNPRAHVTTKFCVVLLAGLLFAAFSLFLAEYTLTGPRSGAVTGHGSRKAITAQSLLGSGARVVPGDSPIDVGGAVTKQEASRVQDAFNLEHYLPRTDADDNSQADGTDTILDDDDDDETNGGDDANGGDDGGDGGNGDVNDDDGAAGAGDDADAFAQGDNDEDAQGVDTDGEDENVLPVVANPHAHAAHDDASNDAATSQDSHAGQAPKHVSLAEDEASRASSGDASAVVGEPTRSRDGLDAIAEDAAGNLAGDEDDGTEANAAEINAVAVAARETGGATAPGEEDAAGAAEERGGDDAQAARASIAAEVDDTAHGAEDSVTLGAGDADLAREGDESLAVDKATEGAVGGRDGASAAAHAAHGTAVEGDDVAEAERAAQDVAREGDEALHPAEPLHVDADEAARDADQQQALLQADVDGVVRPGDEASIVEQAVQDASKGSEVVDEAVARSDAEEERREEEKLVAPDEAAAAEPARSDDPAAGASDGAAAASGTPSEGAMAGAGTPSDGAAQEDAATVSRDAAQPARSAVEVDARGADTDGAAGGEQGGEKAAASTEPAGAAEPAAVGSSAPDEVAQESAATGGSPAGPAQAVRVEAGDEDNEEAALAIAIAEHSVTASHGQSTAQTKASDASSDSGDAAAPLASGAATQTGGEDHDAAAEEDAEHVQVAHATDGVAASDEPAALHADAAPGVNGTARDQTDSAADASVVGRESTVLEGGVASPPTADGSASVQPAVPHAEAHAPVETPASVAAERPAGSALTVDAAAVKGVMEDGMVTDAGAEAHASANAQPGVLDPETEPETNSAKSEGGQAEDQPAATDASAAQPASGDAPREEVAAAEADAHQNSTALDAQVDIVHRDLDDGGATSEEEDGGNATA